MAAELDIVIPVYNEGANILGVLGALKRYVRTPLKVLLCYDCDDDNTLPAVRGGPAFPFEVRFVKNHVPPRPDKPRQQVRMPLPRQRAWPSATLP